MSPRSTLIKCEIGVVRFDRSLLDLGTSRDIMPKTIYDEFKFEA